MRNLKRTLSLVMAMALIVGMMVVSASAVSSDFNDSAEITNTEAVDVMTAIGVFEGTDKGAFNPSGILTREQAAKIIAVMLLAIPGTIEQGLLGNIDYMAGIAVAVGSIPGAVVGARLVRLVPERTLRFIFGGFLIVAAVVLVLNEVGVL